MGTTATGTELTVSARASSGGDPFVYSLSPVLKWLRLIGLDLIDTNVCCSPWLLYGLLSFFLNIAGQFDVLLFVARPEFYFSSDKEAASTASSWNSIIDFTNHALHGVGSQLVLMAVVRNRWSSLLGALRRSGAHLDSTFYKRLHSMSFCGVVYIVFIVNKYARLKKQDLTPNFHLQEAELLLSALEHHFGSEQVSLHRIMISATSTLTGIYPISILTLFCLTSYASAALFQSIRSQIEQLDYHALQADRLAAIQHRYTLSCEVVDLINDCFGCNLLLSVSFLFVCIINSTFYTFGDDQITLADISFALTAVIHLMAVCLAADHINSKVRLVSNLQNERFNQ